ncbi:hypothetical protein SLEP1_g8311 [Rubroshorea leprosula]|uniref:Uncharacterized protein n=1 Tax=Rubroshorea leprosula TaxID=152421 RepID=A0AAV5IC82_9ROSI|nr:hypothetical protein SLEP1_g8311 [Rubroshorea leprosula]
MGNFEYSSSLSCLLCPETDSIFRENGIEEDEYSYFTRNPCFSSENEDEYIGLLLQKETSFGYGSHESSGYCLINSKPWMRCARLNAVEWIFNTRAYFGFQFQTAFLSVTYLDRFLSKRPINEGEFWVFPLLSVACLSLAAKMEETEVPPLSEFPVKEYNVENKVIQRMELLVLAALEWKMSSVTPFAFLHYFIGKVCVDYRPKELVSRSVKLIVDFIKEFSFLDHRPSIIAAAAVLAACDGKLTRKAMEIKMDFISTWGPLENENTYSCYNMMREIEVGNSKTPRNAISSDLSYGSIDAHDNPSTLPEARTKRKLTFSDSGERPGEKIFRS